MLANWSGSKSLTKWLTDHGKLAMNPLSSIKKHNEDADRRHEHRMVLPDEWPLLRAATIAGGKQYGMNPLERATLYSTAILNYAEIWRPHERRGSTAYGTTQSRWLSARKATFFCRQTTMTRHSTSIAFGTRAARG
jgi:hypothetical protein